MNVKEVRALIENELARLKLRKESSKFAGETTSLDGSIMTCEKLLRMIK